MDNMDFKYGTLIVKNEDGSSTFIPEDGCTQEEQKLIDDFRAMYPNGKPAPTLEPITPTPTVEDRIASLEDAITMLMGV